jgi:hypothetical protein
MSKSFIYRNLRTKTWSLRSSKRIVIGHPTEIWIYHPNFVVSETVRQRVIAEKKKQVHAGVRGVITAAQESLLPFMVEVTYNPYKYSSFVVASDQTPIKSASLVFMDSNMKVWALNPK